MSLREIETLEEKISELEDKAIGNIQTEEEREKQTKKQNKTQNSGFGGSCGLTYRQDKEKYSKE